MSLLSLYANIVWRGNGPGALCKRKIAATLVSLNNAPQSLVEMHRVVPAPTSIDDNLDVAALQRILAEDPCFLVLDGTTVRLDLEHLISLARSRLVKWVDAVFPPDAGSAACLKNFLAKHMISEQDALVNASARSLFTLPLSSAEAMLDAYWSGEHHWSGTVSPAHDSAEALFLGDNLWFVQPGISVKLNVAALVHRANSLQAATERDDDDTMEANTYMPRGSDGGNSSFPHEEKSVDFMPMPAHVPISSTAPPPTWSVNDGDQDRRTEYLPVTAVAAGAAVPPRLPPPTLLPSAALFAAASRDTVSRGPPTVPAPKPAHSAAILPGAELPDLNAFTVGNDGTPGDLSLVHGGFSSRLPWPSNDSGDVDAGPAARFGSYIVPTERQELHRARLSSSSVYDPLEAAVGEVAENVALEALGDSWIGLDRGAITSNPIGAAGGGVVGSRLGIAEPGKVAAAAATAVADAAPGSDRSGGLQAARGWELFPSLHPVGHNAGRGGLTGGVSGDSTAAAGGGTSGEDSGRGNMSLLEELCMAFVPPVGNVNGDAVASKAGQRDFCEPGAAEAVAPRQLGSCGAAAAAAVATAVGSWAGPWDNMNTTDGLKRMRADPHPTSGGNASGLLGGMSGGTGILNMRAPPAFHLGGYDFQPALADGKPSCSTNRHQRTVATDPATGLQGGVTHDSGVDVSVLGGGQGLDKIPTRLSPHEQSQDRAQGLWRDPAILNAQRGHTAGFSLGLGQAGAAEARPAEALQGFDVAAAAAAAAGRSLAGPTAARGGGGGSLPPPFPIGLMAATAQGEETFRTKCSSSGAVAAMGQMFQPPYHHQQPSPPQHHVQLEHPHPHPMVSSSGIQRWEDPQQPSVAGATAGAVQTGFPSDRASTAVLAGGSGADITDSAQSYSAAAARVWSDDDPQDKVRRLAASLLASSSSDSGSASANRVPYSMGLDLLLRAIRRQDPVACNKAGNLMAVLEGDPYDCLSVVGDTSGDEMVLLDLSRMMALAGPAPTITSEMAAASPTAGTAAAAARFAASPVPQPQAPGNFAAKRQSFGDVGMAHVHPPWMQPAGAAGAGASAPAAPEGHHL
ncbi:hypothetical protein Vafri_9689, partial [Volvox africanus]